MEGKHRISIATYRLFCKTSVPHRACCASLNTIYPRARKDRNKQVPCPVSSALSLPTSHPLALSPLSCIGRVRFLNLCFSAPFHTLFFLHLRRRCKHADLLAPESFSKNKSLVSLALHALSLFMARSFINHSR